MKSESGSTKSAQAIGTLFKMGCGQTHERGTVRRKSANVTPLTVFPSPLPAGRSSNPFSLAEEAKQLATGDDEHFPTMSQRETQFSSATAHPEETRPSAPHEEGFVRRVSFTSGNPQDLLS